MDIYSSNVRIYAQMKPSDSGINYLLQLQRLLPVQQKGRAVPERQLHMTLIHFGKVQDVYQSISAAVDISYQQYCQNLAQYLDKSTRLTPTKPVILKPISLSRFGSRGGTLAVEYETTQVLLDSHRKLLNALIAFLDGCGIADPVRFMKADHNFMHADILRPHITLYKGFSGDFPDVELRPLTVRSMKLLYPEKG